jgi:hypothetical protein
MNWPKAGWPRKPLYGNGIRKVLHPVVVTRTKGDRQHHLSQGSSGARYATPEHASWTELPFGDL